MYMIVMYMLLDRVLYIFARAFEQWEKYAFVCVCVFAHVMCVGVRACMYVYECVCGFVRVC
jgi:hypothetical protein